MDSISKKLGNLGLHDFRNAARFAQNVIVQYEPYQIDIRRATNTDSWGPTPKHLAKVMRHRYEVSMFLMTEYTLKRLVDHMAKRPKNMYEKARKQYVNYGNEWRVVLKCLVLLEYLLMRSDRGKETDQVLSCLQAHKHILTKETMQYRVDFSSDGKMELHERGIKKKCEHIIQLIEDTSYLKRERSKTAENTQKIVAGSAGSRSESLYNDISINADSFAGSSSTIDDSDDFEYEPTPTAHRDRRSSAVDEQRRQRRELLRERIRNSEHQRKVSAQEPEIDLLDFDDAPAPASPSINNSNNANVFESFGVDGEDDDDDEFGDFQSEKSPVPPASGNFNSFGNDNNNNNNNNKTSNNNATLNDLLDFGGSSSTTTPAATNNNNASTKSDAFADLFSMSKNQI
ncbi:Ent5p [Kluyveromyces lactis]|uniref:KLLA0D16654p n=1 Tax=Kluyveromyces lactis (strain ATCC 8585 / CBS 2359 / DSM 70799 / NBRC 1267 / NRRL Y-1140 / WM37) TaxID=284590 RepID=Q6CQJ4_KLULA|nr:uncharacterized protein KLLA0_D16654g [Kluyveromyces lactis]CAH00891.1 KLLA0D16654p [Kluyveromyces lactis]|eukprot:XP_453795.1 uncharacterized protein KLLA0_D16654g [Kluyveromyces lactis]